MINEKATALRRQLGGDAVLIVGDAHNALSGILVEQAGFDAAWAGGLGISTVHGVPDASILTMTEYLDAARCINDAISIPVIADCDTGFGDINNVVHMVRKYEAAGIAAVAIEDKQFPKLNSFIAGGQLLAPIDEFVAKIEAAKATQRTAAFMVFARTEALIAGMGQEEALRRAQAYVAAGADAIIVHSKARTGAEIGAFLARWQRRAPVIVIPTTYPDVTAADLQHLGVSMVIYANHAIRAAAKAMAETLAAIVRTGSSRAVEGRIASVADLLHLSGTDQIERRAA